MNFFLFFAVLVLPVFLLMVTSPVELSRQTREKPKINKANKDREKEKSTAAALQENAGEAYCDLEVTCKGGDDATLPASMKLPIRGAKGPSGTPGEKGERGEDGMPGLPGLPGLSAPTPKRVAFFVGLSENLGPVKEHTNIVFDRVVTNIGSAYDPKIGRFTSPINATYQFNVVVAAQGRQKAAVMIVKNGGMVATVWAESIPYWATASNIVVLSLEKDDQVWLLLLNRASYLHGYMYTTFSGFLIFEN